MSDIPNAAPFPERDSTKPAEQQGLFRKFDIRRTDGSDQPGGNHYGCRYFVLDMTHDQHAPAALRAYAASCHETHPQLAAELIAEFGAAPVAAREPAGWRDFITQLSHAEGGMLNGNRISRAAKELLAAAPAQPETWKVLPSPLESDAAAIRAGALEEAAIECERMEVGPFDWSRTPVHKTVWDAAKAIRGLAPTDEPIQEAVLPITNNSEGAGS